MLDKFFCFSCQFKMILKLHLILYNILQVAHILYLEGIFAKK